MPSPKKSPLSPLFHLLHAACLLALFTPPLHAAAPATRPEPALAPGQAPPIAPRWSFEPWVWEDNVNTRASITALVVDYKKRNIPVGAIIIDSPWSTAYNDFLWNAARYPDPAAMIKDFHAQNIRVLLWMTGNLNATSAASTAKEVPLPSPASLDEAVAKNFGVNDSALNLKWWKGEGLYIDITNPQAADWFAKRLDPLMDLGIDGWKADEGTTAVPDPAKTFAGPMSQQQFKVAWYGWVLDYTRRRNPEGIIMVRPYSHQGGFGASIEKCTMGWSGDFAGDYTGLKLQLDNLYRSAQAGYGPLQVEVGGYQGAKSNKSQFIRYAQFGALMPGMENGGSNGGLENHTPWFHDRAGGTETTDIYRFFATLHSQLVPYLFSTCVDSHLTKRPMVRNADIAKAQHLLGDDLFVSVLTQDSQKHVEFPPGNWIDFFNRDTLHAAGTSLDLDLPLNQYPLYIRAGAILPLNVTNAITGLGDEKSAGATTLWIFPAGKSQRTFYRPLSDGTDYTPVQIAVDESAGTITLTAEKDHDWLFRIQSLTRPTSVQGAATSSYDPQSKCLLARASGKQITLTLQGLKGYAN